LAAGSGALREAFVMLSHWGRHRRFVCFGRKAAQRKTEAATKISHDTRAYKRAIGAEGAELDDGMKGKYSAPGVF
jgi:hypothetical protein